MSSSLSQKLSFVVLALASACGDGDGVQQGLGDPAELEPGSDEIVQDDEKVAPEPEPVVPDEIGLPCDVKAFLALHCQGCHGAEAKNGTSLLTYENLSTAAKKDAAVWVADRALLRMSETEKPMPPASKNDRVTDADLAMFTAWLDDGMPKGRCDE
jgi:hypothetical protein